MHQNALRARGAEGPPAGAKAPIYQTPEGALRGGQGAARIRPTPQSCRMEGVRGPRGPDRSARRVEPGARAVPATDSAWPDTDSAWTDGAVGLGVLSRFGGDHGRRPRPHTGKRHPRPGVRGLPSAEFRRLGHAGTPAYFRYQRFRRNPSGALRMGRQATSSGTVRLPIRSI
jgi:hypothetical protein